MGFEEEATKSPTENVFREGFLVIFYLYVAWDEKSWEKIRTETTAGRLLALHVCRWIYRVIDGRAERRRRARSVWRHGRIRCLSSCTNSFLWPLSLRVAAYGRTSVFRGPDSIQHVGFCFQRYLILETEERVNRREPIKEIDNHCFSKRLNLILTDIFLRLYQNTQIFYSKYYMYINNTLRPQDRYIRGAWTRQHFCTVTNLSDYNCIRTRKYNAKRLGGAFSGLNHLGANTSARLALCARREPWLRCAITHGLQISHLNDLLVTDVYIIRGSSIIWNDYGTFNDKAQTWTTNGSFSRETTVRCGVL